MNRQLTRTDVLAVLAVVAVGLGLFWFTMGRQVGTRMSAPSAICIANLKQIGLSARIYADDNRGHFPAAISGAGGSANEARPASLFELASYALYTPRNLHCPADFRKTAAGWTDLQNSNVSYFLSLTATQNMTNEILCGDRNLQVDGRQVPTGIFELAPNNQLSWSGIMHTRDVGVPCGNLLLADGSVQTVGGINRTSWLGRLLGSGASQEFPQSLIQVVQHQDLLTNRLAIP